jgi:hypothetical protein
MKQNLLSEAGGSSSGENVLDKGQRSANVDIFIGSRVIKDFIEFENMLFNVFCQVDFDSVGIETES